MVDLYKPSSADKEFYEVVKKPNVEFFALNGLDENAVEILHSDYTCGSLCGAFRRAKCSRCSLRCA